MTIFSEGFVVVKIAQIKREKEKKLRGKARNKKHGTIVMEKVRKGRKQKGRCVFSCVGSQKGWLLCSVVKEGIKKNPSSLTVATSCKLYRIMTQGETKKGYRGVPACLSVCRKGDQAIRRSIQSIFLSMMACS